MKAKEEVMTLNDVLSEFVAQYDRPTRKALLVWIGRYPQYERELIEFVAAWAEQEILPPARELSSEDEKRIINRAMSHVQNVIYNQSENRKGSRIKGTQFATLVDEGKNVGFSARELAKACDLDLALLTKLNNRQIDPQSIPPSVAARFAQVLKRPVELIAAFFLRAPQTISGRSFLARGKPQATVRQKFSEAIRSSSLAPEAKARWLQEIAKIDGG